MNISIGKWGNSLAIRIPNALAKSLGIQEGSEVSAELEGGALVLRPEPVRANLAELVNQITRENRHEEQAWGSSQGREAW